jgi:hypothetical protein
VLDADGPPGAAAGEIGVSQMLLARKQGQEEEARAGKAALEERAS